MAKRRKKLAPRLYTYEQLESLMRLFHAGKRSTVLYGGVAVGARPSADPPHLEITYSRTQWRITLARVYRGADGATVYGVTGPPRHLDKDIRKKQVAAWKRYVPVFTPHQEKRLLPSNVWSWYRVTGGVATPCVSRPGVWLHPPRRKPVHDPEWGTPRFPEISRRTKRLVTRLTKASLPGCLVLREGAEYNVAVYTPPTRNGDGRKLTFFARRHTNESQRFHHFDGDYRYRHLEFIGIEKNSKYRWKCSKDAFNGIVEWVLGDIYIPGPG
jgi:hypothetical protein